MEQEIKSIKGIGEKRTEEIMRIIENILVCEEDDNSPIRNLTVEGLVVPASWCYEWEHFSSSNGKRKKTGDSAKRQK